MENILKTNPSYLLKSIRTTSMLSLLIVLIAAVAQFVLLHLFLNQRDEETRIMHLAREQHVLGQTLSAKLLALPDTPQLQNEIQMDAILLDSITSQLKREVRHGEHYPGTIEKLDSLVSHNTARITALTHLASLDSSSLSSAETQAYILKMRDQYLIGSNALARYYEAQAPQASSRLRFLIIAISGLLLALVMSLHFLMVIPMTKSIRELSQQKKQQQQNLIATLENTKDLVCSVNRNYELISYNTAFYYTINQEHGVYPELGANMSEYPILSETDDRSLYERALGGEAFSIEKRKEESGTPYFYEYSFNPIFNDNNEVTGCSIIRRDQTERIETIKNLKESEFSLKEAQRIARIGNWNWDMVNDNLSWSHELFHIFGRDPNTFEPSYQALLDMIHPEDLPLFEESVKNCIEKHTVHDMVHRITLPSGEIRYIHERGFVFLEECKPVRMAGTAQDVTNLEQAKNEILRQNKELQNFVYIISHNIRSPISTIQGLIDLIDEGESDHNNQIIRRIDEKINILDSTIKDLNHSLSLRTTASQTFEAVSLLEVIQETEQLLEHDLQSTQTQIRVDLHGVKTVWGIKSYLSNIVYNLVHNAISYRHPDRNPVIQISAKELEGGSEILLSVSDNGIGMQLNDSRTEKIFSMYGRLSGISPGKGLGLFLVKSQVKALQGRISVTSTPGGGSRFDVYLNARSPEKA